ncbi:signal recognition particle Srp19 [Encephalitozoon intestinalis ATCC 50506]|uniref:Signal recognition particle Srp19 n=1 Tax=Encephalitozoon intestinalis (strain ATCC 50506) TaxID=876142 RepID=E0S8L6_ENCIT|nr:signal recognition particle Srp19 [Encephalitozoon intestinalis ATCC 50506]ADM12010.1 signal recognition particle Srp19 [Encephalitozoon intestinalis ATCC 50506]UTX45798.1 signal recognition particle Srp19 [Encephalitozoon intestinalis]
MENKYFCLYPAYMDSSRALSEGRKYRKEICIEKPRYHEIKNALEKLEIECVEEPLKKHPRDFFNNGRFRIKKEYGKLFVVEGVSQTIAEMRSSARSGGSVSSGKQAHGKVVHGVVQKGVYVENKLNLVRKKKTKKKK